MDQADHTVTGPEGTLWAIDVAIRKCERSGITDLTVGLLWHHYKDLLRLKGVEPDASLAAICEGRRGDEADSPLPVKTVRKLPIKIQYENRGQSWVFGRAGGSITGWAIT